MNENSSENIAILSTAADLVRCLVVEVGGQEVAEAINGVSLNSEIILESTLTIFHKHLSALPAAVELQKGV